MPTGPFQQVASYLVAACLAQESRSGVREDGISAANLSCRSALGRLAPGGWVLLRTALWDKGTFYGWLSKRLGLGTHCTSCRMWAVASVHLRLTRVELSLARVECDTSNGYRVRRCLWCRFHPHTGGWLLEHDCRRGHPAVHCHAWSPKRGDVRRGWGEYPCPRGVRSPCWDERQSLCRSTQQRHNPSSRIVCRAAQ